MKLTEYSYWVYRTIVGTAMLMILLFIVYSCANRLSLTGGPKDETAPMIEARGSDVNFKKFFDQKEFTLVFDEYVKVEDASEQIVISPPLKYNLRPVVRGKKIIFRFDDREELMDSTTYTIQFGEAIQDYTEGNPAENLRYVFSTGPVIDSMFINIHATNLMTGGPAINALVMLYTTMSDTVIRSGRPVYFSRTDSFGLARVENLRPGSYRVFGLTDENKNYQLDLPEESIGSIDTLITATNVDSVIYDLYMFREIYPPIRLNERRLDSTIFAFTVGGDIDYFQWRVIDSVEVRSYINKDTLFIDNQNEGPGLIFYSDYDEVADTVIFSDVKTSNDGHRFQNLRLKKQDSRLLQNRLHLDLWWNSPIVSFDSSMIRVITDDSITVAPAALSVELDSFDATHASLQWTHRNVKDSVILLPGAFSSWKFSNDSIVEKLRPLLSESLSNLIVDVTELDSNFVYILNLRNRDSRVIERTVLSEVDSAQISYQGLVPVPHTLEIITDINRNGIHDSGWFDTRQFPEPVRVFEIDNLRADWDVQTVVSPPPPIVR